MKSPKNLSHKPILSVNNYDEIDAMYANETDVKALSIGKAQYDNKQISLKVWRYSEEKWSRQSEELPIHRNLDLTILFLAALSTDKKSKYSKSNLREVVDDEAELDLIKDFYLKNKHFILPRLNELYELLKEFV